ncbi:hypothetical protein TNCV_4520941 [Trichonephila clavipes]|nr:hypothetical protein TNCV_4520941 [Trichonephila clavipes]
MIRKLWELSRERFYAAFLVGSKCGSWRRSYKIYKQPDIVTFVKLQRLKWAIHLARMNEARCCKEIFLAKPMRNKPWYRPSLRWIECDEKNLYILNVKNWKTVAKVECLEKTSGEGQCSTRAVKPLKKK